MQFKNPIPVALLLSILLFSCKPSNDTSQENTEQKETNNLVKYARRFTIAKSGKAHVVCILGNRHNHDTTAKYVLANDTSGLGKYKNAVVLKSPCQNIAALSSIYANMFYELNAFDNVAAIDNIDYIINPAILAKHKAGQLRELAKTPQIDIEQSITLKPGIIFTFGMGEGEKDKDKKLTQTGLPVAISVDHLEESPLARAEWIKFFAVFVNKQTLADSIFNSVEKNYLELKKQAAKTTKRPTVFSEIKYSEFWYMPGGKSYIASLLKDAGTVYLWADNSDFGSLPLSFEQVYAKAKDADYWINLSMLNTKKELLASESRYSEFKAFKEGKLYNNNQVTNANGYSTYWETGMIYPNRILTDLIQLFHPELEAQQKKELYYYKQIK